MCPLCSSTAIDQHSFGMRYCRSCRFFFLSKEDRAAQQAVFIPQKDAPVDEQRLAYHKKKYPKGVHRKRELYQQYAAKFTKLFGQKLRALDVGANGGFFLNELELRGAAKENLRALEIDPNYAALTREYFGYESDLENIESYTPNGTYHIVTLFDVLEHVDRFDVALARIQDLLEPGGKLLLKLPARRWAYAKYRIARFLRREKNIPRILYIEPGGHLNYWDTDNIHLLSKMTSGLALIEAHYLKPTWTQFGVKGWWRYLLYAMNVLIPIRFFPEFVAEFEKKNVTK